MFSNARLDDASTSSSCGGGGQGFDDLEIARMVDMIPMESMRRQLPTHEDERRLQTILKRIYGLLKRESNERRRLVAKEVMYRANVVHQAVIFLRWSLNSPNGETPHPRENYQRNMIEELPKLVYGTHYDERRKLAILLGVLEATAEIFVMDLEVFGLVDCPPQNREIRRYIANLLTNLTFNNTASKRKLCNVPDLIDCVVRVIKESPPLDQHFSALIRNLSWVTEDPQMKQILARTVPALIQSAVRAQTAVPQEIPAWTAAMHALWNLSSHSQRNRETICDQTGSLEMLAGALSSNVSSLAESASGVMKYIGQQLALFSDKYKANILRYGIIGDLVELLTASSLTTVTNACAALCQMVIKDHDLQIQLLAHKQALVSLNTLRESKIEEIRSKAKLLIDQLSNANQLSYSQASTYKLSESLHSAEGIGRLDLSSAGGGRLLHRRTLLTENPLTRLAAKQSIGSERCSSLPRHLPRNTSVNAADAASRTRPFPSATFSPLGGHHRSVMDYESRMETPNLTLQRNNLHNHEEDIHEHSPPLEHGDSPVLTDSVQCTRSTSMQSLTSDLPNTSGWKSQISTSANSNRQSPVSPSDLPASPTFYSMHANRMQQPFTTTNGSDSPPGNESNNSNDSATNAIVEQITLNAQGNSREGSDDLPQPNCNMKSKATSSDEDNDYGSVFPAELLDLSIEAAMPQRLLSKPPSGRDDARNASGTIDDIDVDDVLLSRCIEAALPKPRRSPSHGRQRSLTPSNDSPRTTASASLQRNKSRDQFGSPNTSTESQRSSHPSNQQTSSSASLGTASRPLAPPSSRSTSRSYKTPPDAVISSFCVEDALLRDSIAAAMPAITPKSARSAATMTRHQQPQSKNCGAAMTSTSSASPSEVRRRPEQELSKAEDTSQGPEPMNASCFPQKHGQISTASSSSNGSISLFEAMYSSSLVQHSRTSEKIRDASKLQQSARNGITEIDQQKEFGSQSTLSEDNFSRVDDDDDDDGKAMLVDVPQDVHEELGTGFLMIDCDSVAANATPESRLPKSTRIPCNRNKIDSLPNRFESSMANGNNTGRSSRPIASSATARQLKCPSASPARSTTSSKSSSVKTMPELAMRRKNNPRETQQQHPPTIPPKPKNALLDGHQVPVKQQAKQAQSVRIPPFNYKKPPMEKPSSDALPLTEESNETQKTLKKLLVTTV